MMLDRAIRKGVFWACAAMLVLPAAAQAQFIFATNSGTITIIRYTGGGDVAIPSTTNGLAVTSIGDRAFIGCNGLTAVKIPDSVTNLGLGAFYRCGLTNVTVGNRVAGIGYWTFDGCTNLLGVTIGSAVASIGQWAFHGCTSLAGITMPDSVTNIDVAAFAACTSLKQITIPRGVARIGGGAFNGCTSLTNMTIPDSVTTIESGAFNGCTRLVSLTIPDSVTHLGDEAFADCSSLTNVTFSHSVNRTGIKAIAVSGAETGSVRKSVLPLVSIRFPMHGAMIHVIVSTDGDVQNYCVSMMGQMGSGPLRLNGVSLTALARLVDTLPASQPAAPPPSRRIAVQGLRSNAWFSAVYDRADVPEALEQICDLAGAKIDWVIPSTTSTTNVVANEPDEWYGQFSVAANAPVAASPILHGIQLWDIQKWQRIQAPILSSFDQVGPSIAVSQDGSVLVVGSWDSVFAVDLAGLTTRWCRTNREFEHKRVWCSQLAMLDAGRSVAVRLPHTIEKWSLTDAKLESILATNAGSLNATMLSMFAARDGKTLVADIGGGRMDVWRFGPTITHQELAQDAEAQLLAVSPDGRFIVLRERFGHWITVHDLSGGTARHVRLRGTLSGESSFAAWSPDGASLAVAGYNGWPCIYDTKNWKPIVRWRAPDDNYHFSGGKCTRLAFAADGTLVARFSGGSLYALRLPLSPNALDWDSRGE